MKTLILSGFLIAQTLSAQTNGATASLEVEQKATFIGGEQALSKFLITHINYPLEAQEQGKEGQCLIQFIVDKEGAITNTELKKDIGFGCGAEALRVVQLMPKWTPAQHNGQPIKSKIILPVTFKLPK